jgi:biopolymer transport protein TolQ
MNAAQDLSFATLVFQASALAQVVIALLLIVSLMSWTAIFKKWFELRAAWAQTERFERSFWADDDVHTVYRAVIKRRHRNSPLEQIFVSGMGEFLKAKEKPMPAVAMLENVRRAMRATWQRESDVLESQLAFLATVGSVSPYIGLFGTVWGIMNAFRGLANVQQATLANVAPGIAEALIATAIGLFAAIPAVIAYNHYLHRIERLTNRFASFTEEFLNILQRQIDQQAS